MKLLPASKYVSVLSCKVHKLIGEGLGDQYVFIRLLGFSIPSEYSGLGMMLSSKKGVSFRLN
jgi:hypothetical protein